MLFRTLCFLIACLPALVSAQPQTTVHRDTLKSGLPTVGIRFADMKSPKSFPMWDGTLIDFGTDGEPGQAVTVYLDKDSIRIENRNFPYQEVHLFPLRLAGRNYTLRLHFNNVFHYFSDQYVKSQRGKSSVTIPETFELANILLLLSPAGQKAGNMVRQGKYYDEVMAYFKPYLSHPVFKALDFPETQYMYRYYEFRENSICFDFDGDKLVQTPYFYVFGSDDSTYTNAFRDNKALIEDFARASRFRDFYKSHKPFYEQQIARQAEWTDAAGMQKWLEKEFPRRTFQSSKVIFSPVILASHSTQQYHQSTSTGHFAEMLMFVGGPGIYDSEPGLSDEQRKGLVSGMLFTEVDHNYVNWRSSDFSEAIDSAFSASDFWSVQGSQGFYVSPIAVFNEYMTHALFSLYARKKFDPATAAFLVARREALMIERRGFVRFREFNAALIDLKKQNADTPVSALYPRLLAWCKNFVKP